MPPELTNLRAFMAVADARSFRAAGQRLGVTHSAVSQSLRRLEDELGVALVDRTTRSVRLTEAGERLRDVARSSLGELERTAEELRSVSKTPLGTLRLTVSSIAESFLAPELLAGFLAAQPSLRVDITVSDAEDDIVAGGFDAGVRLGEVIERDMVAIAVSERQRHCVVAAPSYWRRFGAPAHPRELASHTCIGWRPQPNVAPYRWEFTENGRDFDVQVEPRVTTNDMSVMLRLGCAGAGITFGMEETFRSQLKRGELVAVLEKFSAPFPGFFLYYPKRTHPPAKLRALIDYLRSRNRPGARGAAGPRRRR